MNISIDKKNGLDIVTIGNDLLQLSIVPALGGKITSLFNKILQKEFLWTNKNLPLKMNKPGDDYDSNFFGGIDELLPNDIPETIDGISYPDHGELWTHPLVHEFSDNKLKLSGRLGLSGIAYTKTIHLSPDSPIVHLDYRLINTAKETRNFLWKLHAALKVEQGDKLVTSAAHAKVVDPQYSRFNKTNEFRWPLIEGTDASIVPGKNNKMDFFYLYDIFTPEMQLLSKDEKTLFAYSYDAKVFPYQWYFASYGGFLDHYTVILEPCTTMPISIAEALEKKQCSILQAGEELVTSVKIFAGEKKYYIS